MLMPASQEGTQVYCCLVIQHRWGFTWKRESKNNILVTVFTTPLFLSACSTAQSAGTALELWSSIMLKHVFNLKCQRHHRMHEWVVKGGPECNLKGKAVTCQHCSLKKNLQSWSGIYMFIFKRSNSGYSKCSPQVHEPNTVHPLAKLSTFKAVNSGCKKQNLFLLSIFYKGLSYTDF